MNMKKLIMKVLAFVLAMSLMAGCSVLKNTNQDNGGTTVTEKPADTVPTDAAPTAEPQNDADVTPAGESDNNTDAAPTDEPAQDIEWDPDIKFLTKDFDGQGWDETCFMDAKVTMINLWAYWCGPCVGELPEIEQLSKDYADKDVQILGITYPEEESDNRETVKELGLTYPILFYTEEFDEYMDSGYIPMTIFVGRNGRVLGDPVVGSRDYAEWASMLDEYLAK